ncbi:MAG: rhomboid family intramembrane serine protease [Chitinophagaceae bacterium]|nr:MAG: rhomboid family intramembrane serine protease [Chitinophagaceae bacterium]
MPKQEQTIAHQLDRSEALATAYEVMKQLGWTVSFAGEYSLQASTPTNWKTKGERIICEVAEGSVYILSEMVNGEIADISKKNKKNCENFCSLFAITNPPAGEALERVNQEITRLQESTAIQLQADEAEAEELNQAMNLKGSNLNLTYVIMALNIIVFILMAIDGAGIIEPNGYVHVKWGSNFGPLTMSGDWWRLFTNMFIHFGLIHLAMNMYCLYNAGIYLEPMLGKFRFAIAYVSTGILASLVSLWWHSEPANSAGASGAVFGMYGVFLTLLLSKLIPERVRKALLQNIMVFVAFNLLYGLKGGIDNAAHVGGLLSGMLIGYAFTFALQRQKEGLRTAWMLPAIALLTIAVAAGYLQKNKYPLSDRTALLAELGNRNFKDSDRFNDVLNKFDAMHGVVDAAIGDTTLTYSQLSKAIDETALPEFDKATSMLQTTGKYEISPASHQKAGLLVEYLEQKKVEMNILKQLCVTPTDEQLLQQLTVVRTKAKNIFDQAIKL